MDLLKVREALRLLRNQTDRTLDNVSAANRSTVHRIESLRTKGHYSPKLETVAKIVEGCGYTLGEFFTKLDGVSGAIERAGSPDLLSQLADEQTVKQVQGFLRLPAGVRQGFALTPAPDPTNTQAPRIAPSLGPTRAPKRGVRTKSRPTRRRSTGRNKADI